MFDGNLTPPSEDGRVNARPQAQSSAWAKAKLRLLEYWDYPPAALFWLILTAGTIAVLKIAGL